MFHLQSDINLQQRSRSMGIKFMVVCFLALLMTIPSFFVHDLINERSSRAADVVNEIGAGVGGRGAQASRPHGPSGVVLCARYQRA